jgi:hypothetical protein
VSTNWKGDVLALAALYLMLDRNEDIPVRPRVQGMLQKQTLEAMEKEGLVREHGENWAVTESGRASLKRAVQAQDGLRQFEIYASVDLSASVADEDKLPDGSLRPEAWDPRFAEGEGSFDMRLAVLSWLAFSVTKKPFSPYTTVFLQKLGTGSFSVETFWADVGTALAEVETIVATAYSWTDASPTRSLEESDVVMKAVYSAGQVEQRKRDGSSCSGCGIPLYAFEHEAAERGELLTKCPRCPHTFAVEAGAPGAAMSCPKCHSPIAPGDPRCGGCGATVDFSLPAGSAQTDTTVTTETVWSQDYGVVSYGWYDPFDPFLDVIALECLCYDPWVY